MSNVPNQNPYASPDEVVAAAPWRRWYVWWATSAAAVGLALWILLQNPVLGAIMPIAAGALSVHSLLSLHRQYQAGMSITWQEQLKAVVQSTIAVTAATIAGQVAFFFSCTGMAVATQLPFVMNTKSENDAYGFLWFLVLGAVYVVMAIAFGIAIWLMGPPSVERLRQRISRDRKEEGDAGRRK